MKSRLIKDEGQVDELHSTCRMRKGLMKSWLMNAVGHRLMNSTCTLRMVDKQ